jgi:hypothetical protein
MTDVNLVYAICTSPKVSGTGVAQVKVGAQVVPANCPRDISPAAGDPLIIARVGSAWWIVQRYFTTASGSTDPGGNSGEPPVAPTHRTGQNTFTPTRTASYRTADAFSAGWRTDNDRVYQGEFGNNGSHTGCAFYGNQVASLSGKTVTQAWIKVRRPSSGGAAAAQTVTMGRIAEKSKPSGAPTFSNSFTGPSLGWGDTNTHFTIPNSAAQALVDGSAGGLGIHVASTPYVILDGLSDYAGAFALTIQWTT